jgi:TatA/E family protein of Tat protein translocase
MYLFILESIGTSELILIALAALILFGPRKLPELARSAGKAMNEFRRSTNEFKSVWEREVESEVNQIKDDVSLTPLTENPNTNNGTIENNETFEKNTIGVKNQIAAPEIKEVSQEDIQNLLPKQNLQTAEKSEPHDNLSDKQNWL